MPTKPKIEHVAVFAFGTVFVTAILSLTVFVPEPTAFQYTVFRVILALAAAGVAAFVPGFLNVTINKRLRAGGAMAVFVIVYFFSPAQLVYQPKLPKRGEALRLTTEAVTPDKEGGLQVFFTAWNTHPFEKLRLTSIKLEELDRMDTVSYCCPEERSPLTLQLDLTIGASSASQTPLQTTFEIPPNSSHSFVANIKVVHGIADGDPIVWFGVGADYSTPDGILLKSKSDRIYIANSRGQGLATSYDYPGLEQLRKQFAYQSPTQFSRLLAWFEPTPSSEPQQSHRR